MAKPEEGKQEGITVKKSEDFSEWYTQVVLKAELADYGPVQGTIAYRPLSYGMWEKIQGIFDLMIKSTGHKNVYFPLLIPEGFLSREKEHIVGFAPEVFWVTHSGESKMPERLAIRPTSETIIYSFYSKWIRSWRDLPLLLNQWCNVLRAEIKSTKPFVRGSEFLWQEGHTAHATEKEADGEVMDILGLYKKLIEEYLAVPVITGKKSEMEKFAGALYTTTLEAMMPDGKALQLGTSHNLGQNFAKAFDIKFLDKSNTSQYAWNTSWGVSTRLLGALLMIHGDDRGAIIPPRIAPLQVIIVPIFKTGEGKEIIAKAKAIASSLAGGGISVNIDDRDDRTAGWKFSEYELKGTPLRVEIGPRDVKEKKLVIVRRDTGEKKVVDETEAVSAVIGILDSIQRNLLERAKKAQKEMTRTARSYEELKEAIAKTGGFVIADWCGLDACETKIKDETGATNRAMPLDEQKSLGNCVYCGKQAKHRAYFAKSY
jgi:prolyl-tRNA synthetase